MDVNELGRQTNDKGELGPDLFSLALLGARDCLGPRVGTGALKGP